MDVKRALLAAWLLALAPAAQGEEARKPVDVKVGPVTLQIIDTTTGEQELRAGTRVLVKDAIIMPGLEGAFGGTQARVFDISPGGNACDGYPAVVTVDRAGKVAIDTRMNDQCANFAESASAEGFTFVQAAVPGLDGSVWRFTPERGTVRLGDLLFRPDPKTTWNDLDRMLDHPLSLFGCAPFDAAVHRLTGKQYGELALRLNVGSDVEKKGDYLVGTGCQAHACNTDQGFIGIDRKAHTVFLAMRSDADIKTWPKAASWPAWARAELSAWEKANN